MRNARTWLGVLSRSSTPPRMPAASFFTSSMRSQLPSSYFSQAAFLFRSQRFILTRRFHSLRALRNQSDKTPPTSNLTSPEPLPSLSQRLKKLSREYGWTAFGVYMALSALDFPFCFIAVRALGTERIGHYEHVVVDTFKRLFGLGEFEEMGVPADTPAVPEKDGIAEDLQEAEAANQGPGASLWTQLALAYAIHKSFIFFRVPITAAITPKVVKTLRGWGWNIGKRTPKGSKTPKTPPPSS